MYILTSSNSGAGWIWRWRRAGRPTPQPRETTSRCSYRFLAQAIEHREDPGPDRQQNTHAALFTRQQRAVQFGQRAKLRGQALELSQQHLTGRVRQFGGAKMQRLESRTESRLQVLPSDFVL